MFSSLQEFVDYVWSFYNPQSELYPIKGLTKKDILEAFNTYVERFEKGDLEYVHYSWGGGGADGLGGAGGADGLGGAGGADGASLSERKTKRAIIL